MEIKIKEKLKNLFDGDSKKVKVIVIIGIAGVLLIAGSELFSTPNNKTDVTESIFSYDEYTENLEKRLENVVSSINGVGECTVMITLENSYESVYATNNETKNDNNSSNYKDEYVLYDSENGETPVLIKEYLPQVQGVTIVCTGGEDVVVKEKIIEAVTSLFNIPANRVSVSKIKS